MHTLIELKFGTRAGQTKANISTEFCEDPTKMDYYYYQFCQMTGYTKGNKPVQGGPQYKNKIETMYNNTKLTVNYKTTLTKTHKTYNTNCLIKINEAVV